MDSTKTGSSWRERRHAAVAWARGKSWKKAGLRTLKWTGISVVGIALAYLVLGNAFLKLGGVPWLVNRSSSDIIIQHGRIWSWWPGKVKVDDFRLAFRNDDVEFEVHLDSAVADISLLDLVHQRFVTNSIEGKGLRYRMRLKRDPLDRMDEETKAALPRIAGFEELPLRETTVEDQPPDDGKVHGWTVRLEQVSCSLDEVWIDQVRVTGSGHVRGRFGMVPGQWGYLHGFESTMEHGLVERGPLTVAKDLSQSVSVQIPWFAVDDHGAENMLRNLDGIVEGSAVVMGDRVLNAIPFFSDKGLHFEDGTGPAHASVVIGQGKLLPGSVVDATMLHVAMRSKDVLVESPSGTSVRLVGLPEGIDLSMASTEANVSPRALDPALFHAEAVKANLHFAADPALADARFTGAKLSVPASNMALAGLDRHLGPIRVRGGTGFVRMEAVFDGDGVGTADIAIRAVDLDTYGGRARIRGDARGAVHVNEARLGELAFDIGRGTLDVEKVDVVVGDSHPSGLWWGHADFGPGHLHAKGKSGPDLELPITLKSKDASPLVAVFSGEDLIPGFAAKMFDMKGMTAETVLRRRAGVFDVDVLHAEGDGAGVEGVFIGGHDVMRGAFRLRLGILLGGVSFREGGPHIQLVPSKEWLADQRRELRSTLPDPALEIR